MLCLHSFSFPRSPRLVITAELRRMFPSRLVLTSVPNVLEFQRSKRSRSSSKPKTSRTQRGMRSICGKANCYYNFNFNMAVLSKKN